MADFDINDINSSKPAYGATTNPFTLTIRDNGKVVRQDTPVIDAGFETGTEDSPIRIGDYNIVNNQATVVENSPTDIYNRMKFTTDTISDKPTYSVDVGKSLLGVGASSAGAAAAGAVGSAAAGASAVAGAATGGVLAAVYGLGSLAFSTVSAERAYEEALDAWKKERDSANYELAGEFYTGDDGKLYFKKDFSKASNANAAFSGTEVQEASSKETNVFFNNAGVLNIEVDPIFAATDTYKEMIDEFKSDYAGLTPNTEDVDEYIEQIKNRVDNAHNTYLFERESIYSYRQGIGANVSQDIILDAAQNEIGAYMSESDAGSYTVKVYRDGEIVEKTASEVLNEVYEKSVGDRANYITALYGEMNDVDISDDDKAYILSEIRMLFDSSRNTTEYEVGDEKKQNKYAGMLQKEAIITILDNFGIGNWSLREQLNALGSIVPQKWHIDSQDSLDRDEALETVMTLIGTAESAFVSNLAMQGIEHGIVRPVVGKVASSAAGQAASKAANAVSSALDAQKILASPGVKVLGYTLSELAYNATSDVAFDALKAGGRALAGEEDAWDEFGEELSSDLIMDLIIQYGPQGWSQIRTELDNAKFAQIKPTVEAANNAKTNYENLQTQFDTLDSILKSSDVEENVKKSTRKVYNQIKKDLATAKQDYETAQTAADEATKKAYPTNSEEIGAKLSEFIAKNEENKIVLSLKKKLFDEGASLTTLAKEAYGETKDINTFNEALNKFNSLRVATQDVQIKIDSDYYASGTNAARKKFNDALREVAPSGKMDKADIRYIIASEEKARYLAENKNDATAVAEIEQFYAKYIDEISPDRQVLLDNLVKAAKNYNAKTQESYIESGRGNAQDLARMGGSDAFKGGYLPLWGKYDKKTGSFLIPKTLKTKFSWDKGEMWDVDSIENPILSSLSLTHRIANNIALNDQIIEVKKLASIANMRTKVTSSSDTDIENVKESVMSEALDKVLEAEKAADKKVAGVKSYQNKMAKATAEHKQEINDLADFIVADNKELAEIQQRASKGKARKTDAASILKLQENIANNKAALKQEAIDTIKQAGEVFNKQYSEYGITVNTDKYITSKKFLGEIDTKLVAFNEQNAAELQSFIDTTIEQVAPYINADTVKKKLITKSANGVKKHLDNKLTEDYPDMSKSERKRIIGEVMSEFKQYATNGWPKDTAEVIEHEVSGYKFTYYENGEKKDFHLEGPLAKEIHDYVTKSTNIADKNYIQKLFSHAANMKRLLTSGWDPTRAVPNLVRDTVRGHITSGGVDYFLNVKTTLRMICEAEGLPEATINKVMQSVDMATQTVKGSTFNKAVSDRQDYGIKGSVKASVEEGENKAVQFIWDLAHDKESLAGAPMDWAEGITRSRMAQSAFIRAFSRGEGVLDVDTRIKNAYDAAVNAGRENTTNFSRRGTMIKSIAQYVPYFSQNFSNLESFNVAILKDPVGVITRFGTFAFAYICELERTLSREESRKNYYNLSEYDRENNIVLSLDNGSLITIPIDDTLATLVNTYRRVIETMNNVDPENAGMILVNGLLDLSPFDLSGFTEGDSFNFGRGVEKLGAQMLPTVLQAGYTVLSGRSMYYGSDVSVTAETLQEYGNYNPSMSEYTTASANSQTLGAIADALGIEQWKLQQVVSIFGGNVAQYVVNALDKLTGATEDEQGGKEFVDSVFKSFIGTDGTNVASQFYEGINSLKKDKSVLQDKLISLNEKMTTATGEDLIELKNQYREAKNEFGEKVSKFVSEYLNAYEITGGLTKSQANSIWYLFNLYDDETIYEKDSTGEYYQKLAKAQANNEATAMAAQTLDKYYDQSKNVYKDSSGTWRYYNPYGEQAYYNTINGRGMEYQVGLRNQIEGSTSTLKSDRSAAYDAREEAYQAGNWDLYDQIGADFDAKLIDAIAPYIEKYGAEEVLTNSSVLDYLEEWFFVPSSYMTTKKGSYVSLAHNASKSRAFVRSYIKELFGVSASTYSDYDYKQNKAVRGE